MRNSKKILGLVLALIALTLAMSISIFAQDSESVVLPNGVTVADFGDNTVTDGTNFYATIKSALEGIHLTDNRILYCKPGADVGVMTHGHVCANLTVYGNGASLTASGEQDFELDTYKFCHNGANTCNGVTGELTLTVKNLNGCGAWGQRTTLNTVNIVFENCKDMNRVYVNGTSGINNITLTNCSFLGTVENRCTLYSNANGTVTVSGCEFKNIYAPINLNHKIAGTQTIVIENTSFDTCGTAEYDYAAPVRVLSSVEGAESALTVSGCTFANTVANKNGQDADILIDYGVGTTNASVSSTAAKVTVEVENNESTDTTVSVGESKDFANVEQAGLKGTGTEADPFLIEDLDDLIWFRDTVNTYTQDGSNQFKGKYVKLTADIDLDGINWTPIGTNSVGDHAAFLGTFDGGGHTIFNLYINADGDHLGFFARVGSYAEDCTPTVKNINFKNVDVSSNSLGSHAGSYVAGVIANAGGNSVVTNVHVTGDVYVVGYGYVGGIVGHGYPDIDNCSVKADYGWVNGHYWCVGGIIGYAGEGGTPITNCAVSGIEIWTAYGAGAAIAGLLQDGNRIENVTAENVEITSNSDYCMGYIAGNGECSTITNATVNNVTATAKGNPITATDAVATVNGNAYFSIQEAIKAAAPAGTVEVLRDVTVDKWVMFAESLSIGNDQIITLVIDGLTINGNGHTLTINSIESAGNGNRLFFDATELNINDLTINYADGVAGGIGLKAGTLDNVTFNGGVYGVFPQTGDVTIQNCTFKTNGTAIYFEEERDGLTVTGNTFENPDNVNVILLRGDVEFTNNTIVSGRTVNVVSGSPIVTGNNFGDVRFKVYNTATATIEDNTINNLVFNDATVTKSTFNNNTLSESAQAALDAVAMPEIPTATVAPVINPAILFGLTFNADEITEEQLEFFGDWFADFTIVFNKDMVLNADGSGDGWLAGQYDEFGEGWVKVPFDDLVIEANKTYKVMELAAQIMGKPDLKITYAEVVNFVKEFNCGVYLDDEFIAANPDFSVEIGLSIFNPADETVEIKAPCVDKAGNPMQTVFTKDDIKRVVAEIDGTYYTTLQDAINNANGKTVVVLENIVLEDTVTIPAGTTVTLDLNGKTINYNSTTQGEAMITNKGTLTINDSVGTGVINYNYTGAADSTYGKGNYTISNGGTLTVNGGKITIANLSAHAKYPIDNNSTSGDAILVINGGHLYNYNTSAIRQFCNSTTYKNSVTINGGLIEGYSAIWVQNPGKNTVNGQLTINGGEIKSTAKAYVNGSAELKDVSSKIYFTISGNGGAWSEDSFVALNGGTFNENVNLASNAPATYTIGEDAVFNGFVKLPVAEVNGVKYATLQEAIAAAQTGDTITLLEDVNESVTISGNVTITLDLNGKKVSSSEDDTVIVKNGATVTIKNGTLESSALNRGGVYVNNATAILENSTFIGTNTEKAYGIYAINNANVTIKNCEAYANINADSSWAIVLFNAKVTVESGTFTAEHSISSNGSYDNAELVINGGTFAGQLYWPSNGTLTINGGEIEEIYAKSGSIIINNGTIGLLKVENVAEGGYEAVSKVAISDGTVNSYEFTKFSTSGIIAISGGIFGIPVAEEYCAQGYIPTVVDGKYTVKLGKYVAQVGDVKYESLQDAFANANGKTVVLLDDIAIDSETITIADGTSVTFDMNGKKITVTDNKAANVCYELFYIYGELTVTGNGTIELTSTSNDTAWAKSSSVFHNRGGVLTIANGTFTHLGGTCMAFVVDNSGNWYGDATTNIKDGELTSSYIAIRNRMEQNSHGASGKAILNVEGGKISGTSRAIWAQAASTSLTAPATGAINISGGEIGLIDTARSEGAVSMTIISGGTVASFKGEVEELTVRGGTLESVTILTATGEAAEYVITADGLYTKAVAKVGDVNYATLQEALAALKAGDTLTLLADIEASEIITIDKSITLDGNGKTLTSTAARAINVSGADGVTIKNLTIECSGERAINIIQNATNVTIENVTATAANYTVNVASSAPEAVVAIKNSTLNGLCTVNVSAAGADVTITDSTINCNDNDTTVGEAYAALSLNKDAIGGSIVATNTIVNVTAGSDSHKGRNSAENGTVTINGSTDGVVIMVAVITYPGSNYYYSFASLAEAIEFAKAGETITLLRDITISEKIEIHNNVVIDLNGKKVTSTAQKAFEVYTDATIKNGTIEAAQRCVDTRKAVELTLTDVNLVADNHTSYGNPQPLTIGGSENGTKVTLNNVEISAAAGYGIITFVKTELTATNSTISGYNALYVKPGSDNSKFNFVNCDITGNIGSNDVSGNSFSTIAVRADNIVVNIDANSSVSAIGNNYYVISLVSESEESASGANITVAGEISGNILDEMLQGNVITIPATYADKANQEGYAVSAPVDGMVTVLGKAVAKIGDTYYATLQAAIDAANGGTVTLLADITSNEGFVINGNVEIDLNGKTISIVDDNTEVNCVFHIENGTVSITNGTIVTDNGQAIYAGLDKDTSKAPVVTLENVTLNGADFGLSVFGGAKVTIGEGVSINGSVEALRVWNSAEVTINVATEITCTGNDKGEVERAVAVYENAKVTISNGTFTGVVDAIAYNDKTPTLVITGGTFTVDVNGYCADGYICVADGEAYIVREGKFVAQVGETKYETLQAAIDAANGGTVILLETFVVNAGETVTLDLKGCTITGKPTEQKAYAVITNKGDLTIKNGSIVCDHTLVGSTSYAVNTITNSGKLTITNATVSNTSTASNQIGYAIDNNSTSYNAILVIGEDAVITASGSNYYDGIRLFCNSLTAENSVTVNGGSVSSIWMQNPSDGATDKNTKPVKGSVTITNGTVNGLYIEPSSNFELAISDGYVGTVETFGTANTVETEIAKGITGGTFGNDVSDYVASGYECEDNGDGTYGVKEITKFMYSHTNLTVGTDLSLNFFFDKAEFDGENYYAIITKHHEKTCACEETDVVYPVPYSQWKLDGTGNYIIITANGIAAKEVNCDIFITVYKGTLGEGNVPSDDSYAVTIENDYDSVIRYIRRAINLYGITENTDAVEENEELYTLFADMLAYATEAQIHFGHYITVDGKPVYASSAFNEFSVLMTYATKTDAKMTDGFSSNDPEKLFYGNNLTLENTIYFNFWFKPGLADKDVKVEYTFTHHDGTTHIYTSDDSAQGVTGHFDLKFDNDGFLIVEVNDLAPADIRLDVTVKLYVGGATEPTATVVASVEDQCAYASSLPTTSEADKQLYKSIMKYADSAYAYLH